MVCYRASRDSIRSFVVVVATVAQLVELRIRNAMVAGSSPVCGSFRCGFAPFYIRYLWEYFILSAGLVWSLVYVCMLRRLGVALAIL